MNTEITGKIIELGDIEKVSETFKKRLVVLEYIDKNPQYPDFLPVEFIQKWVDHPEGFKVGDEVSIEVSLHGRKWVNKETGEIKYFAGYKGWKINLVGGHGHQGQGDAQPEAPEFDAPNSPAIPF